MPGQGGGMTEESMNKSMKKSTKESKNEDAFAFIEEQVKHKRSYKVTSGVKKIGITVAMAALFGIVSALSFYFVYGLLAGKEDNVPLPTYTGNENDEVQNDAAPSEEPGKHYERTDEEKRSAYARKYANIAAFCEEQSDMLVTVSEIEDGEDYFEGSVENITSYAGLVLSKNDKMVYVLAKGNTQDKTPDYEITLNNGVKADAICRAYDSSTGLMALAADISDVPQDVRKSIKTAKIGTSGNIRKGDMVYAIGAPQGDMNSISHGYICSDMTKKYLPDRSVSIFDTDMNFAINASGCIINSDGEVIGIISDDVIEPGYKNGSFLGITPLSELINQLVKAKERPSTGIVLHDITKEYLKLHGLKNGVYVQDIEYDSKVLETELAVGDIIISVNDKDINNVEDYTKILESCNVGDEISLKIYREYAPDDKYRTITIELGKDR